jgi:hypothetical protein
MGAAEQDRPDVTAKRRRWRGWQRFIDPGAPCVPGRDRDRHQHGAPLRALPVGPALVAAVPHGHWCTTTLVAGLRQTGVVAPLVLGGPMMGRAFRVYVEQFLAPALEPGDVVGSTTWRRTRSTASARRSRRPAPRSSTRRPTAPTCTRSSSCSPSSSRSCARPRPAPRTSSGPSSAASSKPAHPPNVPTTSTTAAMVPGNVKMLSGPCHRHHTRPSALPGKT